MNGPQCAGRDDGPRSTNWQVLKLWAGGWLISKVCPRAIRRRSGARRGTAGGMPVMG